MMLVIIYIYVFVCVFSYAMYNPLSSASDFPENLVITIYFAQVVRFVKDTLVLVTFNHMKH